MSVHSRDNGRFICVYKDALGQRKERSFGRGEMAEREAWEFDAEMKRRNETPPAPEQVPNHAGTRPPCISLRNLVEEYLLESGNRNRSEEYIRSVRNLASSVYYPFFGADREVNTIDYRADIVPFVTHLKTAHRKDAGRPRAVTTVNRYCNYLSAIFNYAVRQELIAASPMRLWRKAKERPRNPGLTVEDLRRIQAIVPEYAAWAIEVCFNLGVRPGESELFALTFDDVDFERLEIRVFGRKTNSYRVIPLRPEFAAKLRDRMRTSRSGRIVEGPNGKPLKSLKKSFGLAAERLGLGYPVRMYDIRHLFATTMLNNGADLASVSKLLGHSKISMTADVYYHCQEKEKRRSVSLLPSLTPEEVS